MIYIPRWRYSCVHQPSKNQRTSYGHFAWPCSCKTCTSGCQYTKIDYLDRPPRLQNISMNYIRDLKPHIGSEKTLVISDGDPHNENIHASVDSVFLFNIPQGMLLPYDRHQHEILMHHVCDKECSQIIYAAPSQAAFLTNLENSGSPRSLHLAIKFHLAVLLRKKEDRFLADSVRNQILLELYAIEQCKLLMNYFFIRKKIDHGELKVKGLVPQINSSRFKSIFLNGIHYNNLLTMN